MANSRDGRVTRIFDDALGQEVIFRNAWIPNFRARPVGGAWFISNAAGGWAVLSSDSYAELKSVAISQSLLQQLESMELVLTDRNASTYFESYRRWTTPHFRHPVHHIIIATLRCNFSCLYCHANVVPANSGTSFDLDLDTGKSIVDFALNSAAEVQSFEFQGGEALLNKRVLLELIPYIREQYEDRGKQVYLSVQTNASTLTDELFSFLKDNNVRVGTSLDGPAELNDAQRLTNDGKGTFTRTRKQAQTYGLASLPTITKLSLFRWREIIDAQLADDSQIVAFQPVYPINSAAKNWETVGVRDDQFMEHYSRVANYLKGLWRDGYFPLERRFKLALGKLFTGRDTDFADFGNPCGMVHSQIAYHTNGDIYTCDEGRDFPEFKIGNARTSSYDEVVFGPKTRTLKSLSLPDDAECQTCAYQPVCSTCPVYQRAVTGEIVAEHAGGQGCKQTKLIYDTIVQWWQEDPQLLLKVATSHGISASAASFRFN